MLQHLEKPYNAARGQNGMDTKEQDTVFLLFDFLFLLFFIVFNEVITLFKHALLSTLCHELTKLKHMNASVKSGCSKKKKKKLRF